jgi:thioredoxin reductase (NADPH)
MTQNEPYGVLIIGGGPAGLAAALYAARDRYRTAILEKNGLPGGQIMLTEHIENYPGYVKVGGPELVQAMQKQVEAFDAECITNQAVTKLQRDGDLVAVETNGGETTFRARAVILAPGSDYRQLGIPGEDKLRQATRVSYCATCDGAFYRDKKVLCIGGGNTALEDTIYLAEHFTAETILIHRRTEFRAQQVLVEELQAKAAEHNIDIRLPYVAEEIVADESGEAIDHVRIRNVETDETEKLDVDGVFIFVGMVPNTGWLEGFVPLDDNGYIEADAVTMKTAVPGVWVAGDCRQNAAMQLATATSDGVIAAMGLRDYFRNPDGWQAVEPDAIEEPNTRGY